MNFLRFIVLAVFLLTAGCAVTQKDLQFASRENNVCKILSGRVIIYAVFVDSKFTKPWSEYDIRSTLDSLKLSVDWVLKQAKTNQVNLDIEIDHHKAHNGTVPIYCDFQRKTLSATIGRKPILSAIRDIYKWADKIAAEAGKSLPRDTAPIVKTPNKTNDRERLIARLRDIHKTDNVALMYFINNYYSREVSVTIDMNSSDNVEFSIVSFKKPSIIAHEFLHLFGAWDLYITPFDTEKDAIKKKKQAMELFPNEIMAFAYRNIDSLEISPFTKYAIGWEKKLDKKYSDLILGKQLRPLQY